MILSFGKLANAMPLKQFIAILLTALLLMILISIISSDKEFPWFIGAAALGFYVWVNAVLGFFTKAKWVSYIAQSFGLFLAMLLLLVAAATLLSGLSLFNLREYKIMFFATFIFYTCGIVVCTIIRNVAQLMDIHY